MPDQPVYEDTFRGAENRAQALQQLAGSGQIRGDYFVGIEGGIIQLYRKWFSFGCVCIIDINGRRGFGTSPLFELPAMTIQRLLAGEELGSIVDEWTQTPNSKQRGGAIEHLTRGILSRTDIYVQGVSTALIPFINSEMFPDESVK